MAAAHTRERLRLQTNFRGESNQMKRFFTWMLLPVMAFTLSLTVPVIKAQDKDDTKKDEKKKKKKKKKDDDTKRAPR
jgi:hypothetical protein